MVKAFSGGCQIKDGGSQLGSLPRQIMSLAGLDGFLYAGTAYGGVFKIPIAK